jgi:hypothetical protein
VLFGFIPDTEVVNGGLFVTTSRPAAGAGNGLAETVSGAGLSAPYVNTNPVLRVGIGDGVSELGLPSCLVGLVGGTAAWSLAVQGEAANVWQQWQPAMEAASLFLPVPDSAPVSVSLVNTDGWRAPSDLAKPVAQSPDPLAPFVGSTDLIYGSGSGQLNVGCVSPAVFFPQNTLFPFTAYDGI